MLSLYSLDDLVVLAVCLQGHHVVSIPVMILLYSVCLQGHHVVSVPSR